MNMALNDNLLHRRPAAATTSIHRTSDLNNKQYMRRKRRISRQHRSTLLAVALIISSTLLLITITYIRRSPSDVNPTHPSSLAQQWKPRLKKSLLAARDLTHNNNNDEMKPLGNRPAHNNHQTDSITTTEEEEEHQQIYRHKFSKQELGYDIYNCPPVPPEDYPKSWPITDIISNWNPNDVTTTGKGNQYRMVYHSLCVFDYVTQLEVARVYRDKELPFIIRNDPKVTATSKKWTTPNYLLDNLPKEPMYTERSPINHFMFYNANNRRAVHKNWIKPLNDVTHMRYDEWLERSLERDAVALGDEVLMSRVNEMKEKRLARELVSRDHPLEGLKREEEPVDDEEEEHDDDQDEDQKKLNWYYWRLNAFVEQSEEEGPDKLVFDDMPFFDPRKEEESEFYLVDPTDQRGINCRFGMRGVIAESHCDLSRNMIALLEGERRYIIGHPGQCDNLYLYPRGHPSGRHASFDWSNPTNWDLHPKFRNALHSEVVMKAGDVLYLPTAWFHYIVNLSTNIQCNIRSGISYENKKALKECGFKLPSSNR